MAHIRIVHFMIIVIVVLTIFLYSLLYTASPEMNTIIHAGTPHHYVMNSKDSSSNSDSINNNKNNFENGDILVSNSVIASDRNGGVGKSVPSQEQKQSVVGDDSVILSTRIEGEDGIGSVVVHSGKFIFYGLQ